MGKIPILNRSRIAEIWSPFDLGVDVIGTARDVQVVDVGSPLRITVVLEPSFQKYVLEFNRMDVVAYTVGIVDRVNHVTIENKSERGGMYVIRNSDFHMRESIEWEGQYSPEETYHLAIPAIDLTIEILTLELPTIAVLT